MKAGERLCGPDVGGELRSVLSESSTRVKCPISLVPVWAETALRHRPLIHWNEILVVDETRAD